jgi:hypothetical protein
MDPERIGEASAGTFIIKQILIGRTIAFISE